MRTTIHLAFVSLLLCFSVPIASNANILHKQGQVAFVQKRESLKKIANRSQIVLVASSGRSGSTMLSNQLTNYIPFENIYKTHLLPPNKKFKGKILFIYSNPDKAAESALYLSLHNKSFARMHFLNVETSDKAWLEKIGGSCQYQTLEENMLTHDAFGTYEQLNAWLHTQTVPANPGEGNILAIKFENIWDKEVLREIRNFLDLPNFKLPKQRQRGKSDSSLFSNEKKFRKHHNLGTRDKPRYAAYDDARILWEQAPSFIYLNPRGQ